MSLIGVIGCSKTLPKIDRWWGDAGDRVAYEEAWDTIANQTEWMVVEKAVWDERCR